MIEYLNICENILIITVNYLYLIWRILMNNNDLFLDLYNKLDSLLRTYYNDDNFDNSMINRRIIDLKKSNRNEKRLRGIKLNDIRNVRNLLTHSMKNNGNDLFLVNNDLIEFLEAEIKSILNDKKAFEIMTPFDFLYYCELSSDIKEDRKSVV